MLTVSLLVLSFNVSSTESSQQPEGLVLGDQLTCVTNDRMLCIGDGDFPAPETATRATSPRQWVFGLRGSCSLDHEGHVECQGQGFSRTDPGTGLQLPPMRTLSAGWFHFCGISTQGKGICWGSNRLGQIGSAEKKMTFSVNPMDNNFRQLASGAYHNCGIDLQGSLLCWGDGDYGQLGNGEESGSTIPVKVEGIDQPVVSIAVGDYHSCAIDSESSVWCWGSNRFGQLGDGTRTRQSKAVRVKTKDYEISALAAGGTFSCALHKDGSVYCWGSDLFGEIARGSLAPRRIEADTPVHELQQVTLPAEAVSIRAGGLHACARLENQEVWCWGANESGQLGDGTRTDRFEPVRWQDAKPPVSHPKRTTTVDAHKGVDVSYHAGRIRWTNMAREGFTFAYCLATAGLDFRDPFFQTNWDRLKQHGIQRGAYHFFIPADDPVSQAQLFLSHADLKSGDMLPVIDVESIHIEDRLQLADNLRAFSNEINKQLGVLPIIYTNPHVWKKHLSAADFSDHHLWIAEYDVDQPNIPSGWSDWTLWQWKDNQSVPGVAADVDLNQVNTNVNLSDLVIP